MPTPRLDITVRNSVNRIDQLSQFRSESKVLAPRHQYFIAELIMIRGFSILEEAISELACKLVAGAHYLKGTHPSRLFEARSVAGANSALLNFGRSKPRQYLNWNKVSEIKYNTSLVFTKSEPFVIRSEFHALVIDEMRKVRNFVAHRSQSARVGYKEVIRASYGANPTVDVGTFLVTTSRWSLAKIDGYLNAIRIIIRELASG